LAHTIRDQLEQLVKERSTELAPERTLLRVLIGQYARDLILSQRYREPIPGIETRRLHI